MVLEGRRLDLMLDSSDLVRAGLGWGLAFGEMFASLVGMYKACWRVCANLIFNLNYEKDKGDAEMMRISCYCVSIPPKRQSLSGSSNLLFE